MKQTLGLLRLLCLSSLVFFGAKVGASEGGEEPFIKKDFYQQNITLEQFQGGPRGFFRSEAAFDLLTAYVGEEVGVSLSNEEFIALIQDDSKVRARNCPTSEEIDTGALKGTEFDWLKRNCRPGEQIVQVKLGNRWKDVFSLGCLNAVEDKAQVQPPILPAEVPAQPKCRFVSKGQTPNPGMSMSIPGSFVQGCNFSSYAPGISVNIPASVSSRSELDCN